MVRIKHADLKYFRDLIKTFSEEKLGEAKKNLENAHPGSVEFLSNQDYLKEVINEMKRRFVKF